MVIWRWLAIWRTFMPPLKDCKRRKDLKCANVCKSIDVRAANPRSSTRRVKPLLKTGLGNSVGDIEACTWEIVPRKVERTLHKSSWSFGFSESTIKRWRCEWNREDRSGELRPRLETSLSVWLCIQVWHDHRVTPGITCNLVTAGAPVTLNHSLITIRRVNWLASSTVTCTTLKLISVRRFYPATTSRRPCYPTIERGRVSSNLRLVELH